MPRFEDFEEWELQELVMGLYATGPHLKNEPMRKLMAEGVHQRDKKEKERLSKLPHCETCKQVIKNKE